MTAASRRTPMAVGAFLTAWEALCVATSRHSLTAGGAICADADGPQDALAAALTQLGYPEALTSGARLGAALRRLTGQRDELGRHLDRSRTSAGSIWYVVGPAAPASTAAAVDAALVRGRRRVAETIERLRSDRLPGDASELRGRPQLDEAGRELKRRMLEQALVAANGSRTKAAAALGMPLRRLQRLVAKVLGKERVEEMGRENGWPGVSERARWARTYR